MREKYIFVAFFSCISYCCYISTITILDGSVLVYSFGGKILSDPASAFANDLRKQQK
jgi:hypothetical protein